MKEIELETKLHEIVPKLIEQLTPIFGKIKLTKSYNNGVYDSFYFKAGSKTISITICDNSSK